MSKHQQHLCPVCGFPDLAETPRSATGGGSYEICPSCGFQFGVSDDDQGISYDAWRVKWKSGGAKWSSSRPAPRGWDGVKQLSKLSEPKK